MIIAALSNSFIFVLGRVAQLVEQLTFNQWVTGSNPVALTIFLDLDSGNKYNDLANNSLKTLPNLKHLVRRWSEYTLITICKIRSKIGVFSPKIVCKSLLDFFQQSQNKFSVTGYVLECDRLSFKNSLFLLAWEITSHVK